MTENTNWMSECLLDVMNEKDAAFSRDGFAICICIFNHISILSQSFGVHLEVMT